MQRSRISIGAVALLMLAGCATVPPGERDPRDRFERMNRSVYRFNDALDRGVARPVAKAYTKVIPQPLRTGVSNFFENLSYPTTIVNDLLQAKPKPFLRDTARFVVNTTFGLGGLFDPATQMGLPTGDEDLGQTMGRWGIPSGPYLVLPLLGPSTTRDAFGRAGDNLTSDPTLLIDDDPTRYGLMALGLVDQRASLLQADSVLQQSFDPYVFMRNAYLQRREYQVRDGLPGEGEDFEIYEDEAEAPEAAAEAPAAPDA
jgi:phospholipid-binding lipoprotein MlaA